MPSIVLDASAAVELLLRTPAGKRADAVLRGSRDERVEPLLGELARAPFNRYTLQPLLTSAWRLRHNLALRDALYVTLTRRLGALLVTADARLAKAPALGVEVTFVGTPAP